MTLDEARVIVEKHYWSQYAISKIAEAIVSAVSAERRAALTEAAEVCRAKARHDYDSIEDDLPRIAMGNRCDDCPQDIEALRDK